MSDRLFRLPLSREVLQIVADPATLHRHVMALLPDLAGRSASIRADTNTQFRVDLPTERLGTRGFVTIRLRTPTFEPGRRIVAATAAELRATLPNGARRVRPVPDHEAVTWTQRLFSRHRLTVTDVQVSPARRFGTRDGVHFTVREVSATLGDSPADALTTAFTRGIGRGRAYGLGMLIPIEGAVP
jgi:hypothetical protein